LAYSALAASSAASFFAYSALRSTFVLLPKPKIFGLLSTGRAYGVLSLLEVFFGAGVGNGAVWVSTFDGFGFSTDYSIEEFS
jgi:hypothetical protein